MLNLILGTAGTGKSLYIKNKLKENAKNGIKSMLIVPEQFSKTAESEVFSLVEKSALSYVQVFSFTSLIRNVYDKRGEKSPEILTDAGKAVIVRQSMMQVKNEMQSYSKQIKNIKFSFELSALFEDLKRNGINGEDLFCAVQNCDNPKLKDISLIYEKYIQSLKTTHRDMEDILISLAQNLPREYTEGTQIFIDGFESFTYGQYQIISRFTEKSDEVFIALTAEDVFDSHSSTHPLSYTAKTAQKLVALAKKAGVKVNVPVKLANQHRFLNKDLKNVDNFLLSKPLLPSQSCENVFVNTFDSQFKEVSHLAANISKLTKSGYRYNDIAVVCPQIEKYEHQLQESFALADIPYFIDQSRIISSCAPVSVFKSVLEIMDKGVLPDNVLPLLKTQLCPFDEDTANCLENYFYIWQDQIEDYTQPFTMPYSGLNGSEKEEDTAVLERINGLWRSISDIFENCRVSQNKGRDLILKMYSYIENLGCEEILADTVQNSPDTENADLLLRQWEAAVECLNQLYSICADVTLSAAELLELFMLMVNGTEISFAPQTQDCVMISTPQRMKIEDVKAVFILGASQDIFPALISSGGILSGGDIQFLKDNKIELSADFEEKFAFENLYFYKSLTTAREKLFISSSRKNIDRQEILSAEIESLKEALNIPQSILGLEDYCITEEFFVQYVGESRPFEAKEILEKLNIDIKQIKPKQFNILNREYLDILLGEHLILSPTACESYYKCPFSYFLKNVLKVYPVEKAQITQRHAGDYLHWVVYTVLEKYKGNYADTPWEDIENTAAQCVEEYIDKNYPQQIRQSERFKSLAENMEQNAKQLLKYIYSEQTASAFRPVALEEKIHFGERVKPDTVTLSNGKKVSVVGVCDRIDIMNKDDKNYVRIVDYKTGSKKFDLDDVYNGISTQMFLYMNSVLKSGAFAQNKIPAAVMYQPSDIAFKFDEKENLYTPTGMALEDKEVSLGFDGSAKGDFGILQGTDKIKSEKNSYTAPSDVFDRVLDYCRDKVRQMGESVYSGDFANSPLDLGGGINPCAYCGYKCVCGYSVNTREKLKADFENKKEEENG